MKLHIYCDIGTKKRCMCCISPVLLDFSLDELIQAFEKEMEKIPN
jgi:hypothetical protein